MCLVRSLERLGSAALSKEEPDIGAAFLKFSVVTKELSALMKTLVSRFDSVHFDALLFELYSQHLHSLNAIYRLVLRTEFKQMQNISNIIMFPVDTLLKSELRGVKGEMKRPFDKAAKDYESKYMKIEKEKKSQAKEVGMIRSEVNPAEIADEMEKERKLFQLQMCEVIYNSVQSSLKPFSCSINSVKTIFNLLLRLQYLIKYNDIKTKKGIELLQHLVEFYHAQNKYVVIFPLTLQ